MTTCVVCDEPLRYGREISCNASCYNRWLDERDRRRGGTLGRLRSALKSVEERGALLATDGAPRLSELDRMLSGLPSGERAS